MLIHSGGYLYRLPWKLRVIDIMVTSDKLIVGHDVKLATGKFILFIVRINDFGCLNFMNLPGGDLKDFVWFHALLWLLF